MRCRGVVIGLGLVVAGIGAGRADEGAHYTVRFLNDHRYPQTLQAMAFSPDGSRLAVATAFGRVTFVRTSDGEMAEHFEFRPDSMGFSSDGSQLFMVGPKNRKLLDLRRWSSLDLAVAEDPGYIGIGFEDKNGKWLVDRILPGGPAAKSGELQVGDEIIGVGQGREGEFTDVSKFYQEKLLRVLGGPAGTCVRLQVIPRGKLEPNTHVFERYARRTVGGVERYVAVQRFAASDNLVWSRTRGVYDFCSTATGQLVAMVQPQSVESGGLASLSPDQKRFALIGGTRTGVAVEVYDIQTGERKLLHDLSELPAPDAYNLTCYGLTFTPDSSQLLIGTWDTIQVLDIEQNSVERQIALDEGARKKAKPRARGFAAAVTRTRVDAQGISQSAWVWGPRVVERFAVSSRGVLSVGSPNGQVKLWDCASGELLKVLPPAEDEKRVEGLEFSDDGRWLAYFVHGVLHLVDVGEIKPVEEREEKAD